MQKRCYKKRRELVHLRTPYTLSMCTEQAAANVVRVKHAKNSKTFSNKIQFPEILLFICERVLNPLSKILFKLFPPSNSVRVGKASDRAKKSNTQYISNNKICDAISVDRGLSTI